MIGQQHLQSQIEQMIENGTFPRFSIIVGPRGSGKKTLAHLIYQKFGTGIFSNIGTSVDAVRQCIAQSYMIRGNQSIYLLADADNMSNAAKNALLKVTEEPPNNSYFIMTLEDEHNTLETIRSRGAVFRMDRYTPDEIMQYITKKYGSTADDNIDIFKGICDTPGDADILAKCGIKSFYEYVQLVVDNIAEVSLANAFKIPSKVALKDGVEGYDLKLFWKAFYKICGDRFFIDLEQKYGEALAPTQRALQQLRIKGINKQMLMDNWILEVRDAWS